MAGRQGDLLLTEQRKIVQSFIGEFDEILRAENEIVREKFGFEILRYGGTLLAREVNGFLVSDVYTASVSLLFIFLLVLFQTGTHHRTATCYIPLNTA